MRIATTYIMNKRTLQDILPLVLQPSRYLGSEINVTPKDLTTVKLRVALAFPDLYEIGTSHFGLQILYSILNSHKEIAAERVFAPGEDMESHLRASSIPLMSLESSMPLNRFDIVGFSLLYELNYTNILGMLDLANIPFFSAQRDLSFPIIIAGGPCTCNPEPVADIFDAMVVGDGESVVMEMAQVWLRWKEQSHGDKEALLKMWSGIRGVYVPSFFTPQFDRSGLQTLLPRFPDYKTISRAIVSDLNRAPFPNAPIIPFGKPVHDRLRLEVSRGCTRGCRFCQAGMIYRPVRERTPETLLSQAHGTLAATGYEDISLLSLSTGDYSCIVPLMERLMARCESEHIAVSFPSIRAGTLTPELMRFIKKVRKTGFTIAPEAGSQRLRDVINKNITQDDIVGTVKDAFALGWQVIKLYFMIGLPSETDEDLQSLIDLVKELRQVAGSKSKKGKTGGQINVSLTTFIPKPHTPFQWAPQKSLAESTEKIRWVQQNLKLSGIQFKWQNPEASLLEGLWARGDRRLSRLLVAAYKKGCRFDGWSDRFQYGLWKKAFSDAGVDIDFYTTRARDMAEPLPWDHIDTKVSKEFLKDEWEKALRGDPTPDCRKGDCNACGVCDFKEIAPEVFHSRRQESLTLSSTKREETSIYKKLRISYSKQDDAKYFGHLEMVNIFLRALRRAAVPMKFSNGFHPLPKVSFEDPLPVGLESQRECFYITVPTDISPQSVMNALNDRLPRGLFVSGCEVFPDNSDRIKKPDAVTYQVAIKDGFFNEKDLKEFEQNPEVILNQTNRKGKLRRIDLKDIVLRMELLAPSRLQMTLKTGPEKTVRPAEVLQAVFRISVEKAKQASVVKLSNC